MTVPAPLSTVTALNFAEGFNLPDAYSAGYSYTLTPLNPAQGGTLTYGFSQKASRASRAELDELFSG